MEYNGGQQIDEKAVEEKARMAETQETRSLSLFWRITTVLFTSFGVLLAIDHVFLFRKAGQLLELGNAYIYALITVFLSLAFIFYPATKGASKDKIPWYDKVLFGLTIVTSVYLVTQSLNLLTKGWDTAMFSPPSIVAASAILLLLLIEGLRRTTGLSMFIIVVFFAAFPLFAGYMPGVLEGLQYSLKATVLNHIVSHSSILGIAGSVFANVLIGFLVFGVVLVATGGGQAFLNFAFAFMGRQTGGPAKVAILSSAAFGTMTGSVISNVVTTGTFTIPAMKKAGYPAHFAAAVEACASTGGNIMPPVMGTVAFLIAIFLGMTYWQVVVAAAIPGICYYLALFLQVHAYAKRQGLMGLSRSELPNLKRSFLDVLPYFVAILGLVYFLYLGLEGRAPFVASAILLMLAMLRKKTRLRLKDYYILVIDIARILVYLICIMLGIGFIIGSFSVTGIAHSFVHEVTVIAGDNLPLLLVLSAVSSIVLGMGMPVLACYVFLAIIVAPVLVQIGVNPLAAHLFVFYWGLSSYLTPPVALGAYTAAGIANASFFKTGLQAMRLAIAIYIVPFVFIYRPALLLGQAPVVEIFLPLSTLVLGLILVAAALEGYLLVLGTVSPVFRVLLAVSAFLLMTPGWQTDLIGLGLMVVTIIIFLIARKATRSATAGTGGGTLIL